MPRKATGQILKHTGKDGLVYRTLRFRALGERRTEPLGVVSESDAEARLAIVMGEVELGVWEPPAPPEPPAAQVEVPTFHDYVQTWWALNEGQWSPKTREDYQWRLEKHLVPYFGQMLVTEIGGKSIRQYGADKLAEAQRVRAAAVKGKPITEEITDKRGRTFRRPVRPLSPTSINKTITTLGAITESAIEDDDLSELMQRNAARGPRAKVKARAPRRTYLETAGQIIALLNAAGELDAKASKGRRHVKRRAMIATLIFAGLRIGELLALPLDLIDLAAGWLVIEDSKTEAGDRKVKVRGALRDELASVKADAVIGQRLAFPTSEERQMSAENFRSRVLAAAIKRANENLAKEDLPPLPEGLTPHSLRRTFCSLLYALGEDPGVVMDEMGHTDPELALRVYRQAMRRGEDEKAKLRALVEGVAWTNTDENAPAASEALANA